MNDITELRETGQRKVFDIYQEILQRARQLRESELSGDGWMELMWVASELEKTEEVNPTKQRE